jgi:predicted phosphate transport protein (TIGR00153 family)
MLAISNTERKSMTEDNGTDMTVVRKNDGRSWLQNLVRFFVPRNDHFYDFLEGQAQTAYTAAQELLRLENEDIIAVCKTVKDLERVGDAFVKQMEKALAATFVTPIDREDLHWLSSELDDVLDFANSASQTCLLVGLERPTVPMVKLIQILNQVTKTLYRAILHLRTSGYTNVTAQAHIIRQLERDADVVFHDAIYALYHNQDIDSKQVLREEKVLENLENAIDHAKRVADLLLNLAVKHG